MVSLRLKDLPSASTIYAAYASLSASTMLLRTTFNQVIPLQLQNLILSTIRHYILKPKNTSTFTLIIDQNNGMAQNEIFNAFEIYTSTKRNPQTHRLKISKASRDNHLTLKLPHSQTLVDSFQGAEITWRLICQDLKDTTSNDHHHDTYDDFDNFLVKEKRSFELCFDKKHKDLVLNRYVPFVLERANAIRDENKVVKLHTLTNPCSARLAWDSIKLHHPSTSDKLAMDPSLKKTLVDDLDRFLDRKEYYKKVGRAWKRGYLLYGPPGTGKSSLIAAMANYLKFDIYDLQLMNVINDSSLRKLLLSTTNKSILVIEDIDCSVELPDRSYNTDHQRPKTLQFTLAGLLNFIDGLWSSCGDERIIIFTTNNKDRLDPALLRPGRMDMHIHVSYLTIQGFKLLASNYLGINEHWRYREIEELIKSIQVTPAEIAEELMQSTDADFCLGGLVNFLKRKKMDSSATETNYDDETRSIQLPKAKRPKALPIYDYNWIPLEKRKKNSHANTSQGLRINPCFCHHKPAE